MTELKKLLEKVPNQFPDFVPCMGVVISSYQIQNEVKKYLMDNPDATTDDIIRYIYTELIEE